VPGGNAEGPGMERIMPVIFPVSGDMSMLAGVSTPGRMTRVEQRTVRGAVDGGAPSRAPSRGTIGIIGVSSSGAIATFTFGGISDKEL